MIFSFCISCAMPAKTIREPAIQLGSNMIVSPPTNMISTVPISIADFNPNAINHGNILSTHFEKKQVFLFYYMVGR